jgi:hypothetical protein
MNKTAEEILNQFLPHFKNVQQTVGTKSAIIAAMESYASQSKEVNNQQNFDHVEDWSFLEGEREKIPQETKDKVTAILDSKDWEKEFNEWYSNNVSGIEFSKDYFKIIDWIKTNLLSKVSVGGMKEVLPNEIDLELLKGLLVFSDKYEISVQFWPEQTAVYIEKDSVELQSYGGSFSFAVKNAISYLKRINKKK